MKGAVKNVYFTIPIQVPWVQDIQIQFCSFWNYGRKWVYKRFDVPIELTPLVFMLKYAKT